MRRSAGAFVRRKRMELLVLLGIGSGALIGIGIGASFHIFMDKWLDGLWASLGFTFAVWLVALAFWFVYRCIEDGRLARLEKGEHAETLVGQCIDRAITASHCAAAHSTTKIAEYGDIDHLVLTPVRIWVIETKHRRVPPERFDKVLGQLAANTRAEEEWAQSKATAEVPVRACLVLATGARGDGRQYDKKNVDIVVHSPESLEAALEYEAGQPLALVARLAEAVWELGRGAQTPRHRRSAEPAHAGRRPR